ncbi:MAG: glycosyltransferase family 9 protein [Hyphomonadaceae bacterium]
MISLRKNAAKEAGAPAPQDAKRVLVIQLGELAEFVQALAVAKAIREHHVGARITLLTTETSKSLAEKCPYFDTIEADGKPKEAQAITQLIGRIRAAKYDMIYDLEGSSRTANYFTGLRPWPPLWSGPAPKCSHPYVDPERGLSHPIDRLAAQVRAAGLQIDENPLPDLLWLRRALRDPPRLKPDYFGIRGDYVLLLPRGADAEPNRRWPEAKYADLAVRMARRGVTPVILGGPEERPIGAAIVKAEPAAKNLVARPDLFQVIGLAERAAFAVGDDVELMHVAAASGVSCLVFLSSVSAAAKAAPRGSGGVVALTAAVIADLPVEQVERQLRNCGVYRGQAASA